MRLHIYLNVVLLDILQAQMNTLQELSMSVTVLCDFLHVTIKSISFHVVLHAAGTSMLRYIYENVRYGSTHHF
jgi:hypothetical protein